MNGTDAWLTASLLVVLVLLELDVVDEVEVLELVELLEVVDVLDEVLVVVEPTGGGRAFSVMRSRKMVSATKRPVS